MPGDPAHVRKDKEDVPLSIRKGPALTPGESQGGGVARGHWQSRVEDRLNVSLSTVKSLKKK